MLTENFRNKLLLLLHTIGYKEYSDLLGINQWSRPFLYKGFRPLVIQLYRAQGVQKRFALIKTQLMIFGYTHHSYQILEILMQNFDIRTIHQYQSSTTLRPTKNLFRSYIMHKYMLNVKLFIQKINNVILVLYYFFCKVMYFLLLLIFYDLFNKRRVGWVSLLGLC